MATGFFSSEDRNGRTLGWRARLALLTLVALAIGVVAVTNSLLTDRFTENTRNRAELRLALYSGNLLSELRQNAIVPQLLARDPALISALDAGNFTQSSQRLITFNEEIEAASLTLLDADGRVVAATDRARIGQSARDAPYFVDTLRSRDNIFTIVQDETGAFRFFYSRRVDSNQTLAGMIVVEINLQKFERAWAGISDAVLVTDSQGRIILATEPRWRGLTEQAALTREPPSSAIFRAIQATTDWSSLPPDAYVEGEAVMRVEGRVAFRGWRIASFTTYASVRDKVNGVLALEIMVFAILLALAFYFLNRKTAARASLFQRESAELRALNARLQREIAERQRVQENLAVAEQTLQQSSKLAVLGEMSAAVSHELNQPLAAMKTYLAGARLLLSRNRPDEAVSSFQRIDDLIERMGAITKQLKSYARRDANQFQPVNMGDAIYSALALMEPQLRERKVDITRTLPEDPVWVMGDRVRIEQVIINLLRNAMDATQNASEPRIDVLLAAGETAVLTVRDNGSGIADIENLFEPFYTTKEPGDGVGLGLAISSGIVNDLGGRLTARNATIGGAVFEMQLPILSEDSQPDETRAAE
ncbi:C4-dicarboxylate transport sensor protein DctB [Roseovarius sp. THAF27]|uniref:sensor histidine kinase n=1 Tax=Roseovarius TaxID=74030 RepID=UPI001269613C|nr:MULTISPECIES: ATP-binding protein [Roseovarius]MBY5988590.1 sensor histidine kinase [Roseovarius atlanticus]MBY6123980.1 sensor histidine kinase [Roseovarius atlanticus]MBY6148475.1 sensor histidine kinase [Roseovarius atlanticus]QFT80770.1 C4-dicarboxylate transport sensor protein DctB [Roseovarius sp. THAF27]QFT96103.1 C4-dicarboxylate transport sensor protein DctB [Roseovarius sp. THAF8]